ncbi:hypothetical protein [Psychrobacter celer]|uniref:hypothetical protein n=1 Tax=Psychrobacter celer TaxID=306572 RepID=UPI002FE48648
MTDSQFIIFSGAYCTSEMCAEFGKIPPSFLPISNGRLFEMQMQFAKKYSSNIVLTVPSSYSINNYDLEILEKNKIRVVFVPDSLTLLQAVYFALELLNNELSTYILFGDTYIEYEKIIDFDSIVYDESCEYYNWSEVFVEKDKSLKLKRQLGGSNTSKKVVCGLYAIKDIGLLRKIIPSVNTFDELIERYSTFHQMSLFKPISWLDFGHLNTYYKSKKDLLVTRSFNNIECDGYVLTKSSNDTNKLKAEANWYSNLPTILKCFCPQLVAEQESLDGYSYSVEYLYLSNLAELYLFAELPSSFWEQVFESCSTFLQLAKYSYNESLSTKQILPDEWYNQVIFEKTKQRLIKFSTESQFDISKEVRVNGELFPSLQNLTYDLLSLIRKSNDSDMSFIHGDFFFGNILFDNTAKRIKLIDPRGMINSEEKTVYGDIRYEVAKLTHSVIGRYNEIISGRGNFISNDNYDFILTFSDSALHESIVDSFINRSFLGYEVDSKENYAITCLLFISMLPLHKEDRERQLKFIANVYRIYSKYIKN